MSPLPLTVCAAVFCALAAGAGPVECPRTISVRQEIAAAVPGWKTSLDDAPHRLAQVTFFEGLPEEKASLVYDRFARNVATWMFTPEQRIWVSCAYTGTAVLLAKPLPQGTKTCTVGYDSAREIRKMECK
jgi:hypothetical protein